MPLPSPCATPFTGLTRLGPGWGSGGRRPAGKAVSARGEAGRWDAGGQQNVRCTYDEPTATRHRPVTERASEAIALLTLDLHPIFRSNRDIDLALRRTLFKAAATGVDVVQIIPGKGTGQLKQKVLAVLAQKHIKKLYVRVESDPANTGRILVHLR